MFILLLTLLTSLVVWITSAIGLLLIFPLNWYIIDTVLYSVFSFLYLVGSSLVASAFDFYEKMGTDVSTPTVQQLILCVVLGYICMFVYGMSGLIGYKQWRIQYRLFQRRRLLEEDDLDI
ncbi:hypothetical protein ScPMuIL_000943 [Solemya velum]